MVKLSNPLVPIKKHTDAGGFLKKLICLAKIGYGRNKFGTKFDLEDIFSP